MREQHRCARVDVSVGVGVSVGADVAEQRVGTLGTRKKHRFWTPF